MPDLWLPGALRVPGNNGLLAGAGGGKGKRFHTWHSFEAPYTFSPDCLAAARYLNSQSSTSTFCLHPTTGAIAQLLPANHAARTLRVNDGNNFADVNRHGDVHMQTEVIAFARRPFTLDLTEDGRRGLEKLVNFLRSWGIPDQWAWANQPPPAYPGGSVPRRWPDQSGHAYHAGWPVNNHGDPGAITAPWTLIGSPAAPKPAAPAWPKDHIRWVQTTLNAAGWSHLVHGEPLDADDSLGPKTEAVVKAAQTDLGVDVDGKPGDETTTALEEAMTLLTDIKDQNTQILDAIGTDDLGGRTLASWVRGAVNAAAWEAPRRTLERLGPILATTGQVDVTVLAKAVAAELRPDVAAAVGTAGSGATAEQIADELGRRLAAGVLTVEEK